MVSVFKAYFYEVKQRVDTSALSLLAAVIRTVQKLDGASVVDPSGLTVPLFLLLNSDDVAFLLLPCLSAVF